MVFFGTIGTDLAAYFCGAEKDHTGLVTGAVLGTLRVPDEVIADDYDKMGEHLDALFAHWAMGPASTIGETRRTHPQIMGAPREAMVGLLTAVGTEFGSMSAYLEKHGAPPEPFKDLERTLVE